MVTVTDIYDRTHHARVDEHEFADTVAPWFTEAPEEILDELHEVQDQLIARRFVAGSAISSLGLVIE